MTEENIYAWICLRYDEVGLVTAELRHNNETIETLGGSYPKWTPVRIDAGIKWGKSLPVHWNGFEIPVDVKIDGIIEVIEED